MAHINTHKVWSYLDSQIQARADENEMIDRTETRLFDLLSLSGDFSHTLLERDIDIYVATFVPKETRSYFYILADEVLESLYSRFYN